ncbi:MAG: hypothetical protein HY246_20170, partial [Proteobacteria bacterium]|nr:hypothetical protein [Pseudomonadota bacterium]
RGVTVLCHGGSLPGYKAMFARVPERDFGLVLLSNREDAEPYTRLYQVIDIALDGELPEPNPSDLALSRLPAMTIPKETWGALDGRYLDAKSGEPLDVKFNRDTATIEADKLGFALALRPAGADVFLDSWLNFDATLRIEPVADGRPLLHLDFGGQAGTFEWAPAYRPAAADLASTVGAYRSDELRSSCEVRLKDDQLVIRFGPDFHEGAECPLEPLARDMFFAKRDEPGVKKRYAVRFQRAGAAIAGVLISSDRLKDARFARGTA